MSISVVGEARTSNAGRYLQQLCKHWSHKFAVEFDAERGTIELPVGRAELGASGDRLTVKLLAADEQLLDRLKIVVVDHLNRFAFREAPLLFVWQAAESAA